MPNVWPWPTRADEQASEISLQIKRYSPRPRQFRACGCVWVMAGLGVLLAILVLLAAPALPGIILRAAGFEPIANARRPTATANPIPVAAAAAVRSSALLSAAGLGQLSLPPSSDYGITAGAGIVRIVIRAESIEAVCFQFTKFCGDGGHPLRRAEIKLGSGSLVIAGEAFVELLNIWQVIELQVSLGAANTIQIDSLGLDGIHYRIPENEWGRRIREVEASFNDILSGLSLQVGGQSYLLSDIIISENQLVAAFR